MTTSKKSTNAILKELKVAAHEMDKKGLVVGSAGNLSVRVDELSILISARSSFLGKISSREFILIDFEGKVLNKSKFEPSSECRMHIEIYRKRKDVRAIVHTHSPYASAYAFLKRELRTVNPESQYILGKIPIVPYFQSGSKELAEAVAEKMKFPIVAALLESHGAVSVGKSIEEALNIAEMLEGTARINYLIDSIER